VKALGPLFSLFIWLCRSIVSCQSELRLRFSEKAINYFLFSINFLSKRKRKEKKREKKKKNPNKPTLNYGWPVTHWSWGWSHDTPRTPRGGQLPMFLVFFFFFII
jgi:hypothetical protein